MQKKLTLHADALRVESFETVQRAGAGPGTVRAHDSETGAESCIGTCQTCYTENYTCEGQTCDNFTCDWNPFCAQTFGVTCPHDCRTSGVVC